MKSMILTVKKLWDALIVYPDELQIYERGKNDKLIHDYIDMEMEVLRIEDREVEDFAIDFDGRNMILEITLGDML